MKQMSNYVGVIDVRERSHRCKIDEVRKNTVILNSNGNHCNSIFYVKEQAEEKKERRRMRMDRGKQKQSFLILSTEKTSKMNTLKPRFYIKFPT